MNSEQPEVGVREVVVTITAQFAADGYLELEYNVSEPVSRVWLMGLIEMTKDVIVKRHT